MTDMVVPPKVDGIARDVADQLRPYNIGFATAYNAVVNAMLRKPAQPAWRTPTIEEWYGTGYTPTFPDDDGEEMRRISTKKPVEPPPDSDQGGQEKK